jgi:hypothetical protein
MLLKLIQDVDVPGSGGPLNSGELVRRGDQDIAAIPDHHIDLLDVGLVQVQPQLLGGQSSRHAQQVFQIASVPGADHALSLGYDIGPVGRADIRPVARVDMPLLGLIDDLQSRAADGAPGGAVAGVVDDVQSGGVPAHAHKFLRN